MSAPLVCGAALCPEEISGGFECICRSGDTSILGLGRGANFPLSESSSCLELGCVAFGFPPCVVCEEFSGPGFGGGAGRFIFFASAFIFGGGIGLSLTDTVLFSSSLKA